VAGIKCDIIALILVWILASISNGDGQKYQLPFQTTTADYGQGSNEIHGPSSCPEGHLKLVSINPKCGFFDWFRSATFDLKENI
jgi:hypothetical protein